MAKPSIFREMTMLITVKDLCSEFIGDFRHNRELSDFDPLIDFSENDNFNSEDPGVDPYDYIGLVSKQGTPYGWFNTKMINDYRNNYDEPGNDFFDLEDIICSIKPHTIITANTSAFDAVNLFVNDDPQFYFVLEQGNYIGWLSYKDFIGKMPFKLCLFAFILNIEQLALQVVKSDRTNSIAKLSPGRLEYAKRVSMLKGFKEVDTQTNLEWVYQNHLLDCTTYIDKISILKKSKDISVKIPALKNKFCQKSEELRNALAHPTNEFNENNLLNRETLLPFIKWAFEFESQLISYLKN